MSYLWRPKPKPPTYFTGQLTVCDANRQLIPGLRASLMIETEPEKHYLGVQKPERVEFAGLPAARQNHGCYINLEAEGFHDMRWRTGCAPDMGEAVMTNVAATNPVQQIIADGKFFRLADGSRHFVKDATSFMSFLLFKEERFAELDAHYSQLRDLGFNCGRVLLSCRNMFSLELSVDEMCRLLPLFVRYTAGFGLNANLVAFADTAPGWIGWPQEELEKRWLAYGNALQEVVPLGPLYSLVNEVDQAPNIIPDTSRFGKIPNILCSRGSRGSRGKPVRPWIDFEEYHNNNEVEHWREGHNAMEFTEGDAEGHIEPSGVPMELSETKRTDNEGNVTRIGDSAECSKLLNAGWCFHAPELRYSQVMTGHSLECAQEAIRRMDAISVECQPGGYKHRKDLERPDAGATGERAYQRGDSDACISHSVK